ncbi:MAG: DUF3536 domain-containing protein [Candidatus Gastranaerophilales bacterium]|nr:DUF3536 domain-containing protein [Candidatus Gastranaerophilales bacterium]
MSTNKKYLTIHGHFYQPPRENPWLEAIEVQESAKPFHDWNERIDYECYNPNSVSRIVDGNNKIIDIVNNYEYISFNFGPTLLSWLEEYDSKTYERIIEADTASLQERDGHGNALAQNYNHIIMPLANERDKYTQVIWGIKDFLYRFGRKPEGMWVAETAIDYDTVDVLIDCGIKFTILSPFQALKTKEMAPTAAWVDVSAGNIDPARSYRCYSKSDPEKYLDVFFYDGSISKSVAFDNLLQNGEKFISRLKDGTCPCRNYNQLVNIATDGESYGHHTKFGDMALSYVLRNRAEKEGFTITNYAQYLSLEPPKYEVELKPVSSWSCFHGVERWNSDCGCQTGSQPGWNQKWRKPLRQALNYLRDELITIFEEAGGVYFQNVWKARNDYIDVLLDRNQDNIEQFIAKHQKYTLENDDVVQAIKLLEMQRQSLLSFTSCGWFFSEISGIETLQIMKYAARAIQLAGEFSDKDIEGEFLEILDQAKSNIPEFGTGKQIYEKWVKPSVVDVKQFISHWAITSLYQQHETTSDLYCYEMVKKDYRMVNKNRTDLIVGRIEAKSKITMEKHDMIFALLHFGGEDFQCAIKDFTGITDYNSMKSDLIEKYDRCTLTDVVRAIDEYFGKEYYTITNLFTKEKKAILSNLLSEKLDKFVNTFNELYSDGKPSILQLREIGLETPMEFKIVAEYIISKKFNNLIKNAENLINDELVQKCLYYIKEAQTLSVKLHKEPSRKIFEAKILRNIKRLIENTDIYQAHKLVNILSVSKQLDINPQIREAQNIYFQKIFKILPLMIKDLGSSHRLKNDKILLNHLINIGELLDVDVKELYIKLSNVKEPR